MHINFKSSLHYLLEPKYRKELDFQIVFDDKEYLQLFYHIYTRIDKCKKTTGYPPNCTHCVTQIKYGIYITVIFPKQGFPQEASEV